MHYSWKEPMFSVCKNYGDDGSSPGNDDLLLVPGTKH